MTHVIGKELTPGTECQFTADVLSRFEDHLETLTASCIVEGNIILTICSVQIMQPCMHEYLGLT